VSSSSTNGSANNNEKGHPTIAPIAKSTTVDRVRRWFSWDGGFMQNENARRVVYMAKVDGMKAMREMRMTE
jgi:hypothetical protein